MEVREDLLRKGITVHQLIYVNSKMSIESIVFLKKDEALEYAKKIELKNFQLVDIDTMRLK